MERTYMQDLVPGSRYKIQGFVENFRNKRTMAFIVVKDITGKVQVTVEKESHPDIAAAIENLTVDSVITVEGELIASEYVKLRNMELIPDSLVVESLAEPRPIKEDSLIDARLDYRWIDLRSEKNTLIFKMQTAMVKAMRDFLYGRGFMEIHSPKLIGAASESGADVFEMKYFDRKAYLAQSPQFYKQMAMAAGFDKIFEVGPVFRAEKSFTSKHTTEFTGFDLEFSYITSFRDVMKLEEDLLRYTLSEVKAAYGDEIKALYDLDVIVPETPFPVIKLCDLYKELKERYGYEVPASEMGDLTTDAEKLSYRFVKEVYNHEFLFVTDFDAKKRAFYHMRDENGVPMGYDLIWRGVEITTGAQREHRYEVLRRQADEKGLGEDVKNYMQFFRYGCPPHGGFGIGVDRLTMLFLGLPIKEAMFLFRGPNRLEP